MKKRKIINKKGISLVVAMALSIFLMMITGTFLSLSIFQQNDTGAELNTRQAYVSAKSALDLAKEMALNGKLKLPAEGKSLYYVLYKNGSEIIFKSFSDAKSAMEDINKNRNTVIGDSYIKITNNGGGSFTMSAFSSVGTYTPGSENHGDLSVTFNSTTTEKITKTPVDGSTTTVTFNNEKPIVSSSATNRFLIVGSQTNFSLLKSITNKDFQTIKQEHKSNDNPPSVIYEPYLNTDECPLNSHFPLVYTNTVKIDSNSYRCVYQAYNDGIYFLGNYTGNETSDYRNPSVKNVSYFTNNNSYGTELHCKFITISHNMVSRTMSGQKSLLVKEYGNDNYKYSGQCGVVIYLPNGSTFSTYDDSGNRTNSKTYTSGYYWLPTGGNNEGTDLFSTTNGMTEITTDSAQYKNIADINMYSSMVDESGNTNDMHSAYESETAVGKEKVSILSNNGKFTTSTNGNSYSTTQRSNFTTGYENYSIYCGPSATPTEQGYYNLYCGKDFNYLWYNNNDMVVQSGVKMFIRSNNDVLTIGPDTGEGVYKFTQSWGYEWRSANKGDGTYEANSVYTASNVISAQDSSSEFWLCPYWNQSAYTITIMNDFTVNYSGGTYTVHEGEYSVNNSRGINLLSDNGKEFFTTQSPNAIDAKEVKWVNSDGSIKNAEPASQNGKSIDFIATSGSLYSNGTYEATIINCDFSGFTAPLEANTATLKADYITIKANQLKGNNLNIKVAPKECSVTENGTAKKLTGQYLTVESDIKVLDSKGKEKFKIEKGTYFFATTNSIDIMAIETWKGNNFDIYLAGDSMSLGGYKITTTTITDTKFPEGGYF